MVMTIIAIFALIKVEHNVHGTLKVLQYLE